MSDSLKERKQMNCNKQIETQYIGELPIDTLEKLPDFFLTERDILDEESGNTIRSITRTPGAKLFPNANTDNIFPVEANNPAIDVPESQVRGVYVQNQGATNAMQYADTTHPAVMLAVGQTPDVILCQCSGAVNLPLGHSYIVSVQYYQGANGEPTTTPSSQKLFIPVSNTRLVINM